MENKVYHKQLVQHLINKVPAKLSRIGIFNQDNEYINPKVYKLGFIESFNVDNEGLIDYGVLRLNNSNYSFDFDNINEIEICVRPLHQLTTEIEHNGEKLIFSNFHISYNELKTIERCIELNLNLLDFISANVYNKMLKYNFDVFSLIDKNLAIELK